MVVLQERAGWHYDIYERWQEWAIIRFGNKKASKILNRPKGANNHDAFICLKKEKATTYRGAAFESLLCYSISTSLALGPFSFVSISNRTLWPSFRVLNPDALMPV